MHMLFHRPTQASFLFCFFLVCVVFCSCKKEELLLNQQDGKTDLSVFIFSEIAKYGGPHVVPSATMSGLTDYVYSEDKDGFQIICKGNKVAALQSLFQTHFGNPLQTKTNASGLSFFVYGVRQAGMGVSCGWDSGIRDGTKQEITQLVVLKPER